MVGQPYAIGYFRHHRPNVSTRRIACSRSALTHIGQATAGKRDKVHFPADLLRRHHLYVARTRMGESTLMRHIVVHKMNEKAAGMDDDAIVVIDPHAAVHFGVVDQSLLPGSDRDRLGDIGIGSLPPYRRSPSRRIPERAKAEQHRLIRWWTTIPREAGHSCTPLRGVTHWGSGHTCPPPL